VVPSGGSTFAGQPIVKVFTVSNSTELRAALVESLTLGGTVIRLNPGNYGSFRWERRDHAKGRVFIVAATSTMPTFTFLSLNQSTNISLDGLKVSSGESIRLVLSGTRNVTFTGGEISGLTQNQDPWDEDGTGIHLRFASNAVVQDVKFSEMRVATFIQRVSNVHLRYNRMMYLREGINVAAADGLTIQGNHISHIYPRYDIGEHPDAIQFWTTNETAGSNRVRLIENVLILGGKRAVHGVLAGSERAADGIRHKDFEVSRNVYFGSAVHGLSFGAIDGLKLRNNVVVGSPHSDVNNSIRSADGRESGGYTPRMRAINSTGVEMWNNVLMTAPFSEFPMSSGDNWDLIDARGNGLPWTDVLVQNRPTEEHPPLSAFITRNPSLAYTRNGGVLAPYAHGVRSLSPADRVADALKRLGL
jgi:hypothetical protein